MYLLPQEPFKEHEIYVLIDILRATSSISTLIHCGVDEVFICEEVDTAKELKPLGYLIAGERNAIRIEGFDFGNSPIEFLKHSDTIRKRPVALTTTNGAKTMKIINAHGNVIALSLLNFTSVLNFLLEKKYQNIGIVCSGTDGNISLEDCYAAGLFLKNLLEKEDYEINDGAKLVLKLSDTKKRDIANSFHALRLKKLGFKEDVDFCFEMDMFNIIPFAKKSTYTFRNLYMANLNG